MKRVKITDVARRAGVSTSTVDRVLNKRPGVRRQTIEKVQAVLASLGYSASQLGAISPDKTRRFVALLPSGDCLFMDRLAHHLQRVATSHPGNTVRMDVRRADLCEDASYIKALRALKQGRPDGAIVVSIDNAEAREAIDELVDAGIQVVTIVSDVPQSRRAYFVGIDNLSAGRTAGNLMARFLGEKSGTIGVVAGNYSRRDHLVRRSGLEQILAGTRPDLSVIASAATCDDDENTEIAVSGMIRDIPDLVAVYNVGSGNLGVAKALEKSGRQDLVVIGHEMTSRTRRNLVSGLYDAVVAQDYWAEADFALRALLSFCNGDRKYEDIPLVSIDIYIKDNLP